MRPEFYSFQMSVLGGLDAFEFAFLHGRFGRMSDGPYVMRVLLILIALSNEENA